MRYSDPVWYVEDTTSHVIGYWQRKLFYEEDKRSRKIPDGNRYCRISNVILFAVKILTVYCHIENDNLESLFIFIQERPKFSFTFIKFKWNVIYES